MAVSSEALRFDGVTQSFGTTVALEGIDLSVRTGEFLTIVGPSGCGKSTLLRLAAGLISPTGGRVSVHDEEVSEPRRDVGFMFQKPTLLPWLSARENVMLPKSLHSRPTQNDRAEADRLLELVGLQGSEYRYPDHLSGGMQQRVALARLLMTGADLLLLDEPFGALDEFTREKLNFELLDIRRATGATIVLVTHSISEAVLLGDRVVAMSPRPGRIAEQVEVGLGDVKNLSDPAQWRLRPLAEPALEDAFDDGRRAA